MALEQADVVRVLLAERAKLLAYIWSIVHDEHAVEDVFQEVSLLAVQKCDEIQSEEVLWPWLRQTAKFRSLHVLRMRGKQLPFDEELLGLLDATWQEFDQRPSTDLVDQLLKCVAQLSPYAQKIVTLRYVDGLSGIEVANQLNRQARTIYMALTRIHANLRRCMQKQAATLKGGT